MEYLYLIGKILFGGYFVMSGWNHFTRVSMLAGYAGSKGVPMPKLAVLFSGALIFIGGLGVIFSVAYSSALIALFLVPVTFAMHAFWKVSDVNARMGEKQNFLKNMALLGAALLLL